MEGQRLAMRIAIIHPAPMKDRFETSRPTMQSFGSASNGFGAVSVDWDEQENTEIKEFKKSTHRDLPGLLMMAASHRRAGRKKKK